MRAIVQRWTSEDDERLRALSAQGASIVKAAAALKRRQSVVRDRANKLGCPFPTLKTSRQKWASTPNNMWRDH
jgi:GcrA cell cycle regulator